MQADFYFANITDWLAPCSTSHQSWRKCFMLPLIFKAAHVLPSFSPGESQGCARASKVCTTCRQVIACPVLHSLMDAGADRTIVFVGPRHERSLQRPKAIASVLKCRIQSQRLGTAHAVLPRARRSPGAMTIFSFSSRIRLWCARRRSPKCASSWRRTDAVVALGFKPNSQLVMEGSSWRRCSQGKREDRDATAAEREIETCNAV